MAVLACPSIAAAQLTGDPDPLAFDPERVGAPPVQLNTTLTNAVDAPGAASNITCAIDPPTTNFTVQSCQAGNSIPPGGSGAVAIRFRPLARGAQSATLTVSYEIAAVPMTETIALTGTGIAPVMEVSVVGAPPQPLDFETAVVGTASETTYTIQVANTGDDVLNATLAESGANPGDWTYAPAGTAFQVPAGGSQDVVATFTPTAAGARASTVTFADADVLSPVPSVAIDLVGNGEPPLVGLGVSPTALVFGSIDVQVGKPVTRMITVTNPGNQVLTITPITLEDLEGEPYEGGQFEVLTPAPLSIEPLDNAVIEVRYQPELESAGDFAILVLGTNVPQTPLVQVSLSGRGVDRHIDVSPLTLSFAPTYRNPAVPPEATLEVRNTGETPLVLGDIMIEGDGASAESFSVVGELPAVLEPEQSSTLTVRFTPRAPEDLRAALHIVNDDDSRPIVRVDLSGEGVLPPLSVTYTSIEWETIAVGQERPLPQAAPFVVRNESDSETFLIQDVRVADDTGALLDGIVVAGFTGPLELGPGQELPLEVSFVPRRGGVFAGAIEVLVDPDPEPVVRVPVMGAAVATDARGGAGCAAGGGAGPGGVLVIALSLGLGLWWRRRGLAAAALLIAWAGAAPAWAQVQASEDVNLASFRPVHGVDPIMVTVESVDVGQSGTGAIGLAFDHARNPLVLRAADGEMIDHPVATRTTFELAGAFAFGERFEVAAVVPFLSQRGDQPQFSGIEPADGTSLGDIRLRGKAFFAAREALRFGGAAELTLPTALDKQFAGVAGPSALLRGLLDYRVGRLQLAFNAGAVMRERVRLADVQQGHAAVYGAGGALQLWSRLYAVGEVFGAVDLSGGSAGNRPLEAVAALRVRATRELGLLAGVGRGILAGVGAPEARVFFAMSWAPGARVIVAPGEDPREMGDDDGDAIVNRDDECPDEIEDADGFRDADGCPDRDDDADGVSDLSDQCPRRPEDADGFADDDGCPEGDNDHDSVADADDRCPGKAEDADEFEDEDGCPDPDNDSDGIDDVADRCVAEKETINGNDDDDGCPDGGASLVIVGEDEIRTLEPIRFASDGAELTRSSQRLLGQVGATLRAHRHITRVRIRAHVHRRGDGDEDLSVQRAEAVRRWLVDWGIASERLEGIGFGSREPAQSGNGPRARAANDRIVLEIVERRP